VIDSSASLKAAASISSVSSSLLLGYSVILRSETHITRVLILSFTTICVKQLPSKHHKTLTSSYSNHHHHIVQH